MVEMDRQRAGLGWIKHCLIVGLLIGLGYGIVAGILLIYGDGAESVYLGNREFAISPVYNRDGSWLHGRLDIGFRPGALFVENLVSLALIWFCVRLMMYLNRLFKLSDTWLCFAYFYLAAIAARLINSIFGKYTMDYLYIRGLHATYDLFDIYLGIGLLMVVLWAILAEIRYHRIKKAATRGMGLWQKLKWELGFTAKIFQAVFSRRDCWEELGREYQYNEYQVKTGGQEPG